VQDYLEGLFLVVSLEVAILGVEEEEEDKLMTQIQSFLELSLVVEDQEAATVGGGEDRHQERINLAQDSLGCWEEGIIIVVIAPHNTTTTMVDITVGTIMDTTMVTTVDTTVDIALEGVDITVDTTLGGVDTIQEGVDTIQEGVDTPVSGVSVTTDLCSRTSMVLHMVHVREGMRLVRDGVTLRGMAVKMPGSHRGFLTTLGHT